MIRIETKKEVNDNGELGYKVTKINALMKVELPELYTRAYPYCYQNYSRLEVYTTGYNPHLEEGRFYSIQDFDDALKVVKECGIRLKEANATLARLRCQWTGNKTFEI